MCAALTHQQIELLLRKSKPSRIPGLGTRAEELENHAIANIAALQAFPVNQLQQMFYPQSVPHKVKGAKTQGRREHKMEAVKNAVEADLVTEITQLVLK